MAGDDSTRDDPPQPTDRSVAAPDTEGASPVPETASEDPGVQPEAIATTAASGAQSVAQATGQQSVAQGIGAATSAASAAQSVAQAAQSGDPTAALGAAGSVAGATGAVAGATGASEATQAVSQAASVTQQTTGMAATMGGLAGTPLGVSPPPPPTEPPAAAPPATPVDDYAAPIADAVETVIDSLTGTEPIAEPRFEFALPNGPEISWVVKRFSITSELSRLYEMHIELVCDDVDAPIDEMLGAPCELFIERGDLQHSHYGIIDEIDDAGPDQERFYASIRVIPALGLLADKVDTRIFQGQTVVEILTQVLGEGLAPYEREVNASDFLKREYNPRDYCTQFRESTLDFCCRLMEEEGIAFQFLPDHEGNREQLVLIDNNNDYPAVELSGQQEVPIVDHNPEEATAESVRGVLWRQRRHINKVSGRAYNFKAADTFEEAESSTEEAHNHHEQELYLHDRRRQITEDPIDDAPAESFDGTGLSQREPLIKQVLEEHRVKTKTGYGTGLVTGFRPGGRFTLGEHHRADLDGADLLLVRVTHHGEANTMNAGATAVYDNEFTVVPVEHEYRPPQRHQRARVYGPQLARVVGEADSNDEIHTDSYGRIKVQFHHDRYQPADANASVWMRVMQPWAGPGWGTMFIPRVGMEVIVQFVDGNPDNPLVVGSVYNSQNMPPYPLPGEKTKSTIKSSSSVGGDGYNELTFEDAAGSEQIIVHAQKDFNKTVLNNQSRSVGADDSTSVSGNQTLSVTKDRTHSISGNETISVTGSQKVSIDGASTGDGQEITGAQLGITGQYKVDASEFIEVQAPQYIRLTVGDSFIKIEPDKITLQQKDGARVVLSPDSALMASKENSQAKLDADAQVQASTGGDLTLTANAQMSGNDAQVLLDGEALVQAKAGGEVKLNADATMKGANATVDGESSATVKSGSTATLTAGGSTVKTAGSAVDVSGPQANIAGQGAVNITGGIIKLN